MAARAMWKGTLEIGGKGVAVKLYSGAVDQRIHFRLLHGADKAPVEQRMINPNTNHAVEYAKARRGYPVSRSEFVIIDEAELAKLEPAQSRAVEVLRYVPANAVAPQWYVRPYYLGPDGDASDYFAFARALAAEKKQAIVRWTMRKKAYVGALRAEGDYLCLVTLRSSDEIISAREIAPSEVSAPNAKERTMAEQLIQMFEGPFEPEAYHDEYRERVRAFVDAKARGKKTKMPTLAPQKPATDLSSALAESLKRAKERAA